MNKEEVIKLLQEPNGSEKLAKVEGTLPVVLQLARTTKDPEILGPALSYLTRMAGKKASLEEIQKAIELSILASWLASDAAKVRKNTARLLSKMPLPGMEDRLMKALTEESIQLVRPSLLLALGRYDSEKVQTFLRNYTVPADGEEKHRLEEEEALRKALERPGQAPKHPFMGWPADMTLVLVCSRGMEAALKAEVLEKRCARVVKVGRGSVTVQILNSDRLMKVRSLQEILIPLRSGKVEALAAEVTGILNQLMPSEFCWGFRLEMKKDREALKEAALTIERTSGKTKDGQFWLSNRPSDYEVEVRALSLEGPFYLKLWNIPEARFEYRKEAVPASIHPVNAAGLIRLAQLELQKKRQGKRLRTSPRRVLDPCCGSGTLLYERILLSKERKEPLPEVVGVDIEKRALTAARANAQALLPAVNQYVKEENQAKVHLFQKDLTDFAPLSKEGRPVRFHEIYANLPFGIRVGDHEMNVKIYPTLVRRLSTWLRADGFAVLYTMEGSLLRSLLQKEESLEILSELKVEAGGLEPKVFIVIPKG